MEWAERDLQHIWHPCAQMKDYEIFKPMVIAAARGSYIELNNGKKIIDAISSWWCKSLGHNHPRLKKAIRTQIEKFEHVILAHTTYENIVKLSEKLASLTQHLSKIFYAGDGSCAVEIALKMSLHSRQIQGDENRKYFMALENAYHGETIGALSVSDMGIYKNPYRPVLFESYFISSLPYVSGIDDPLWHLCPDHWAQTEMILEKHKSQLTAIIVEPIVQGAAGMKVYSQDFLRRLRSWTQQNNVHLIADEIMSGFGRTGKMLACQHAEIEPDFLCLSKGLTSGWLPLSAVLTSNAIYDIFYDDYAKQKSFLHSHTYTGNALAVSVALEVLNIFEEENICDRANQLGKYMREYMVDVAATTGKLQNVRGIGAIVAADLMTTTQDRRLGFEIYKKAAELGALLRPMGNTLYWFPPLTIDLNTLQQLRDITIQAIEVASTNNTLKCELSV